MIRIILILIAFIYLANITTALSNTKAATKKPVSWISTKLRKFIKRVEEECDFGLLYTMHEELKNLWDKVKTEQEYNSGEMDDVQKFIKTLVECYSECSQKKLLMDFEGEWEIYLKVFGKKYSAAEKEMRKAVFKKKKEDVEKHNELYRNGLVSYSVNLNHLSDLILGRQHPETVKLGMCSSPGSQTSSFTSSRFQTEEELNKRSGYLPSNESYLPSNKSYLPFNETILRILSKRKAQYGEGLLWKLYLLNPHMSAPGSFDWREKRYVTPVRFDGGCGACYVFGGIGALEAYHKKRTGNLEILSVQNILDCTWHLGNFGCVGGRTASVFSYAKSTGVLSNARYPYTMNASRNCQWNRQHVVATDNGYYFVERHSELALRNAIVSHGPVAANIGLEGLFDYHSGVFKKANCGPIRHTVLVVGYGSDPEQGEYWIVKNGWGFWWGEDGYARIARNKKNTCHIASEAYFPF